MGEEANRTNYEQEHPRHPTEKEFLDRSLARIDKALAGIAECEDRMARNAGRRPAPAAQPSE